MFILVIVLKFLCYYLGRCFTVSSAFSFCNQMAGYNLTSLIKSSAVVQCINLSVSNSNISVDFIHTCKKLVNDDDHFKAKRPLHSIVQSYQWTL